MVVQEEEEREGCATGRGGEGGGLGDAYRWIGSAGTAELNARASRRWQLYIVHMKGLDFMASTSAAARLGSCVFRLMKEFMVFMTGADRPSRSIHSIELLYLC